LNPIGNGIDYEDTEYDELEDASIANPGITPIK